MVDIIQGPQGIQGVQGQKGDQGEQGQTGFQGIVGPQGIQGPVGPKGDKGDIGPEGPRGAQGYHGPMGPSGGEKGEKGDQGLPGANGAGVKNGGLTGQVLAKKSSGDYDTEWVTPASGGGGGSLSSIRVKSMTNDDGNQGLFITGSGGADSSVSKPQQAYTLTGNGEFDINLAVLTGAQGTYAYPSQIVVDSFGRVKTVTEGTAPTGGGEGGSGPAPAFPAYTGGMGNSLPRYEEKSYYVANDQLTYSNTLLSVDPAYTYTGSDEYRQMLFPNKSAISFEYNIVGADEYGYNSANWIGAGVIHIDANGNGQVSNTQHSYNDPNSGFADFAITFGTTTIWEYQVGGSQNMFGQQSAVAFWIRIDTTNNQNQKFFGTIKTVRIARPF